LLTYGLASFFIIVCSLPLVKRKFFDCQISNVEALSGLTFVLK